MTSDSIRKTEAAGSRGRCESLKPHLLKERKEYKAIARTFDPSACFPICLRESFTVPSTRWCKLRLTPCLCSVGSVA